MSPYEKLRSIPNARIYLKESITFEILDKTAKRYTDNEMLKRCSWKEINYLIKY